MELHQNRIGINITESKLQLVELISSGDSFILERIEESYFNEFLDFTTKETKLVSNLQGALDEILIKCPIKSKLVSVTLPHKLFYVIQLPVDNTLRESDLIQNLKWEMSLLYPNILSEELSLQYVPVYSSIFHLNGTVILAALQNKYISVLQHFCESNKLKLKYVDNVHVASDNLVILDQQSSRSDLILSIYINPGKMSVSIIQNCKPIYFKIFQINNIAEISVVLEKEIKNNKYFKIEGDQITGVYLIGEKISDSLSKAIQSLMSMSLNKLSITEKFKVNPEISLDLLSNIHSFSAALGIACRIN